MDHHCPWTSNCVSHTTFPHFLRFLLYTTLGLTYLESLLLPRLMHLWYTRDMPSYLGPSAFQLAHLFVALIVNSITLFAIGILLIRNLWCLAVNTTTIEGWEIERHTTLLRRARAFGGYLTAADGSTVRMKRQEFPYDIGILSNIAAGMGTRNPLSWLNPLARTRPLSSGLAFPTNGFEDSNTTWPPPDPDRMYRRREKAANADAFVFANEKLDAQETLAAFRARQAEDEVRRRKPFLERAEAEVVRRRVEEWDGRGAGAGEFEFEYGDEASGPEEEGEEKKYGEGNDEGEESWRNSEGERLLDFGVDEDVEFYDEQEDQIPLSELLARRRAAGTA